MNRTVRSLGVGAIACASLLSLPAAGHALSGANVVADAGAPQPLTEGLTFRNVAPVIQPVLGSGDARYKITVTGPDGVQQNPAFCNAPAAPADPVRFVGPGAYRVTVQTFRTADGSVSCGSAGTPNGAAFTATMTIQPSVAMAAFPAKVLTRRPAKPYPAKSDLVTYPVGMVQNPGATYHNVRILSGPDIAPGGTPRSVDAATGLAQVTFYEPGTYQLAPEMYANGITIAGGPITVQAVDPFDVSVASMIDRIGPKYKFSMYLRTDQLKGKKLKLQARRKGAKKYRTFDKAKVKGSKQVSFNFKTRALGKYNWRVRFGGSKTVAKGFVGGTFKFRRR